MPAKPLDLIARPLVPNDPEALKAAKILELIGKLGNQPALWIAGQQTYSPAHWLPFVPRAVLITAFHEVDGRTMCWIPGVGFCLYKRGGSISIMATTLATRWIDQRQERIVYRGSFRPIEIDHNAKIGIS